MSAHQVESDREPAGNESAISHDTGSCALVEAASRRSCTIARQLLADPRVSLYPAVWSAIEGGHVAMLQLFMQDERFDLRDGGDLLLKAAAKSGHAAVVEAIVASPWLSPHAWVPCAAGESALSLAASLGHTKVVQLLLADPRADVIARTATPLQYAILSEHADTVDVLLSDGRCAAAAFGSEGKVLFLACSTGRVDVLERLLAHPRLAVRDQEVCVLVAASKGHFAAMDRLLADRRVNAANALHFALRSAAKDGEVAVVERLLTDRRTDTVGRSGAGSDALCAAAESGQLVVVARLLADARVAPAAHDGAALRLAAEAGHLDVVDRLLANARVDPAAGACCALRGAARAGHLAVVERLLADPRVDPSAAGQAPARVRYTSCAESALVAAAAFGHAAVVERLLADPRAAAGANCSVALAQAAFGRGVIGPRSEHATLSDEQYAAALKESEESGALQRALAIVNRLLTHTSVDPSADENAAVIFAAGYGPVAVLDRLLTDPRVDPTADSNAALRFGRLAAVDRLLADPRVDPTAGPRRNAAIHAAAVRGHLSVVERLLANPRVDPSDNADMALEVRACESCSGQETGYCRGCRRRQARSRGAPAC